MTTTTPPPRKFASAAQRTISLFTGKTDAEDPARARDGTYAEPKAVARQPTRATWKPVNELSCWERGAQSIQMRVETRGCVYELRIAGRLVGSFVSLPEACAAADAAEGR